jgi:hypothetical protein
VNFSCGEAVAAMTPAKALADSINVNHNVLNKAIRALGDGAAPIPTDELNWKLFDQICKRCQLKPGRVGSHYLKHRHRSDFHHD